MRLMPRRLFGRLALGLTTVSFCAVALGTFYLYARFHDTHSPFFEGTLQGFAGDIAFSLAEGAQASNEPVGVAARDRLTAAGGRFVVVTASGRRVAGTPGDQTPFVPYHVREPLYFWLPATQTHSEFFGLSVWIPNHRPATYVQVMFPSGHIEFQSVLHVFMRDVAWLWIPFLLAILAVNVLVARLALSPLSQIVEEVREIQPGGTTLSLTEHGLPDDLLALVRTLNEALARLREAHRDQEAFVADMAHELRTPLAVMKAQLTTGGTRDAPSSVPDVTQTLAQDLATMERLVEQLLDRARLGRFSPELGEPVDLRVVAREAAAFLAPHIVARGRIIAVEVGSEAVEVPGGYDDIFRAVRNLIENALEHSPADGLITVAVVAPAAIVVSDSGPGFPDAVLDVERRRRGLVRSDRRDGAGLGLYIIERTMLAHHGSLELSNTPDGGRAEMRFPSV